MPDPAIPTPLSNGTTDIPAGPPPVPAGFSDAPPSAPPVPSGFSDQSPQTVQPEPSMLEKAGSIAGDLVTGAGKGLMSTVEGLGSLIKKTPQVALAEKLSGHEIIPQSGLKAEETMTHPQGAAQMVGYGGENLAEFLLGDEALKGLSMADKFAHISGVAKILGQSPRLMKAIQMGADVGKAATELGPEEQAALKKSPILARLVGTGMDAIRQGTVQGVETGVKTGGDVKKAAVDAGSTALASGVLGSAFGALGRGAEKAGEAGKAVEEATEKAATAPTKLEAGQKVASQIQDADTKMHGDFEKGIQDLKGKLGDAKVPYQGSPLQKAAQEALQGKTEAKGTLGSAFQKIAGGSDESKNFLNSLNDPKNTGDLTIDELVQRRQQLGEKIGQITKGNTSSAERADVGVYRKLRDGIDQTIESLAKNSDSPEASHDYKALRDAYHAKVNLFKEPVIRAMQDGDLDNAGKHLLAGGKVLEKLKTLEQVIGPDGVKQFGQHIADSVMADAVPKGGTQINPANFTKEWKKIDSLSPEVKAKLFDMDGAAGGLDKLSKNLKSAANYQKLVRGGVMSAAAPVSGLGLILGLAGAGDMAKARDILDVVANNPRMWSAFRTAGKVGEKVAASPTARRAASAATYGAGSALSNVLAGATEPLSSPEENQ